MVRRGAYEPQILAVTSEGKLLFLKLDTDYRIILKHIVRKCAFVSGLLYATDSQYKAADLIKNMWTCDK